MKLSPAFILCALALLSLAVLRLAFSIREKQAQVRDSRVDAVEVRARAARNAAASRFERDRLEHEHATRVAALQSRLVALEERCARLSPEVRAIPEVQAVTEVGTGNFPDPPSMDYQRFSGELNQGVEYFDPYDYTNLVRRQETSQCSSEDQSGTNDNLIAYLRAEAAEREAEETR